MAAEPHTPLLDHCILVLGRADALGAGDDPAERVLDAGLRFQHRIGVAVRRAAQCVAEAPRR